MIIIWATAASLFGSRSAQNVCARQRQQLSLLQSHLVSTVNAVNIDIAILREQNNCGCRFPPVCIRANALVLVSRQVSSHYTIVALENARPCLELSSLIRAKARHIIAQKSSKV